VIYGMAEAPPLPGARFSGARSGAARGSERDGSGRQRPGEVRVLSRHVVVRPMPPRVPS